MPLTDEQIERIKQEAQKLGLPQLFDWLATDIVNKQSRKVEVNQTAIASPKPEETHTK